MEHYLERIKGTNIDPRSFLSTDYFNHFNTVIMLLSMLPESPDLLDEIDNWTYISYVDHFKASGLDFAELAIELYQHVPQNLRVQFDKKVSEIKIFIEMSRLGLRQLLGQGNTDQFRELCTRVSRELQQLVDDGGAIVHGHDQSLTQESINTLFD